MSDACIKLSSVDYHVDEIIQEMGLDDQLINVKKRLTCQRNSRSKVLSIYAVQKDAEEIDETLMKMKSPMCKHMSHRKTMAEERLVAMHHNDVRNIKGKDETLHNVNLKDEVWDAENSHFVMLESILMKVTHENHPLFLASEQGAGKFHCDVITVMNLRAKMHSKI